MKLSTVKTGHLRATAAAVLAALAFVLLTTLPAQAEVVIPSNISGGTLSGSGWLTVDAVPSADSATYQYTVNRLDLATGINAPIFSTVVASNWHLGSIFANGTVRRLAVDSVRIAMVFDSSVNENGMITQSDTKIVSFSPSGAEAREQLLPASKSSAARRAARTCDAGPISYRLLGLDGSGQPVIEASDDRRRSCGDSTNSSADSVQVLKPDGQLRSVRRWSRRFLSAAELRDAVGMSNRLDHGYLITESSRTDQSLPMGRQLLATTTISSLADAKPKVKIRTYTKDFYRELAVDSSGKLLVNERTRGGKGKRLDRGVTTIRAYKDLTDVHNGRIVKRGHRYSDAFFCDGRIGVTTFIPPQWPGQKGPLLPSRWYDNPAIVELQNFDGSGKRAIHKSAAPFRISNSGCSSTYAVLKEYGLSSELLVSGRTLAIELAE
ncbi:MAG: hypothetical protein JHC87_07815 [Thermoleophilaceae bacterium]|nr:hypothetical protein [Thermoleophilaceae bacterium]